MTELTIVLPVQNVADSISSRLRKLLEVIPSMTSRFEIVVVDDASSDITPELVAELGSEFPQIRLRRHYESRGLFSAIRTGCYAADSKRVFVQTADDPISPNMISRFWNSGAPNNLLEISDRKPIKAVDDQLIGRLSAWCDALKKEKSQREDAARLEVDPHEPDRNRTDSVESDRIQRLDRVVGLVKTPSPKILSNPTSDFGSIFKDVAATPNIMADE